jgi:hypothetical protein
MTTPQEPAKRHKQKIRRTKQLAAWRAKQPAKTDAAAKASPKKAASKAAATEPKKVVVKK